ncbi:MAG: hypothetical protein LBG27_09235, partial [Spirochaetaceae bacterium]|nr:hypothetical protein [Spirochaetaceae bacterium]
EEMRGRAGLPEERRALFETRLGGMKEKGAERAKGKELAPHILSVPGIGIEIAAALPACLGTGGGSAAPDRRPTTPD